MLEGWSSNSYREAASLLLAERDRQELQAPWSIAELEITDEDYSRLCAWLRHMDGEVLASLLDRTDAERLPACRFAGSWGHLNAIFAGSWGHPFRSIMGPPVREG